MSITHKRFARKLHVYGRCVYGGKMICGSYLRVVAVVEMTLVSICRDGQMSATKSL